MDLFNRVSARTLQWTASAALLAFPLAILPARLGIWHFRNSFLIFIVAAMVCLAVLFFALMKLARQQLTGVNESKPLLQAAFCSGLPLVILAYQISQAASAPMLHDISTDLQNPPQFNLVLAQRTGDDHGAAYEPTNAALQAEFYSDIQSHSYPLAPAVLAQKVTQAMVEAGLTPVGGMQSAAGTVQLEATQTSLLFGFVDDLVVRITPTPEGSVLDIRSMSRQGKSDLGQNAKRIRCLLLSLEEIIARN
jgi:uncharacterized protein (DUF1499 family)